MSSYANLGGRTCNYLPTPALCASFYPSTREVAAVDLALKLDVLAVCAVFVFVGAVLLGAF